VVPLRGNVDTRMRKLDAGEADAIVLAVPSRIAAGLLLELAQDVAEAAALARMSPPQFMKTFKKVSGTTLIAGHRTTYLAPFRHIDALHKGNTIRLDMPYGRFTYTVVGHRVVAPTAVATAVFKDKNLKYVFRAQIHSEQYGQAFAGYITEHAKAKLGVEPTAVKVAIIHEDGPYGVGVAAADEEYSKKAGLNIVMREGYSAAAPDLSALVTKLKRAAPDVISHAGYNPDITLFLRQARESGLRFKMLIGAGAGYSQLDKLRATFGKDIDNFCNIDPVPAQLLDPKKLAPGIGELTNIMVERYKAKANATDVPPHCSMGFNQTWILLNSVLPIAKEKYGGFDAEAVRKAALDVDIAPGGTIQGYGVKFFPPGTQLAGQNERSTPVVMQNAGEHISVVYPTNIRTQDPVLPLPKSSVYAM